MDRVSGTSFFGCSAGWFGAGAALPPASAGFSFAASPFASSPPVGAAYLFPPLVPPDGPPRPALPPGGRRPPSYLSCVLPGSGVGSNVLSLGRLELRVRFRRAVTIRRMGGHEMRLTKFSHACVRLEGDGVLVIDPGGLSEPEALDGVDAVLITHEHFDHFEPGRLADALAKRPSIGVFTNPDVAKQLTELAGVVTAEVDTLFVPASGPWLKLSEAVEFVRAVAPRRAYALHDGLWNEMGQTLWDRNMAALARCEYARLAPGESV